VAVTGNLPPLRGSWVVVVPVPGAGAPGWSTWASPGILDTSKSPH